MSLLIFSNSFAETLETRATATESGICEVCISAKLKAPLDKIPLDKVGPTPEECQKKKVLFDPKFKSIFERNNVNIDIKKEEAVFLEHYLSCAYGVAKGMFLSVKDLLMIIPMLVNLTVKATKWSYKTAKSGVSDTSWIRTSVDSIDDFATGTYRSTKKLAIETWDKTTTTAKAGFIQGGVGGAASAVAVQAYESSPHATFKNALGKLGTTMMNFVGQEWDAFGCMSSQGKAETMCTMMGYLLLDVATGKVVWGNLAKTPKIIAAIESTKKVMMKTPVVGNIMMRNYKVVDEATLEALNAKKWKLDGKVRGDGATMEVLEADGKVYARGIDAKSQALTTYEVVGKSKSEIEKRLGETAVLESQATKTNKANDDLFNPANPNIARTTDDFVRSTNREVAVDISDYNVKKISDVLRESPSTAQEYGSMLKTVSDYQQKTKLRNPTKLSKDDKQMNEGISSLMKEVNGSLARSKRDEVINLSNINKVIEEAITTGDRKGLDIYKNAIAGLNQAGGPTRFDAFFTNLGYNQIITKELQNKVRSCLISKGSK